MIARSNNGEKEDSMAGASDSSIAPSNEQVVVNREDRSHIHTERERAVSLRLQLSLYRLISITNRRERESLPFNAIHEIHLYDGRSRSGGREERGSHTNHPPALRSACALPVALSSSLPSVALSTCCPSCRCHVSHVRACWCKPTIGSRATYGRKAHVFGESNSPLLPFASEGHLL